MKNRLVLIICFFSAILYMVFPQVDVNNQKKFLNDSGKSVLIDLNSNAEVKRLQELKSNLNQAEQKLSTDLLQLIRPEFLPESTTIENHSETMISLKQLKPFEQANNFKESINEGIVYVYLYLNESNSTSIIDGLSEEVTDRDEVNNLAVAWVKVRNLEALASLDAVRIIRTVIPPIKRTGSVNTEGDAVHRTSNVRSTYGENGTGIRVGIISDGVDTRATAQASGDLPPDGSGLTVLSNTIGGDEGTAMLEIIYDMVPGAELYFHDHGANIAAFNTAIDNLVTAGCNVICDDIGWLLEPYFEDGIVASHVSSVISANDIIYVSSAGNAAPYHYQGNFFPLSGFPTRHDFSGVNSSTPYLYVELSPLENVIVVMQWNDPFGGSGNDYDLELRLHSNGSLVAQSVYLQNGTQDPLEALSYTNPSTTQTRIYQIRAINYLGAAAVRTLEVYFYPGGGTYYTNNIIPGESIYGHPAVDDVVSVGAVRHNTPSTIEYFSSQGPSTIAFPISEVRQTPKVVGVDGVSITGAGGFPNPFYGTSAAVPHIAAILAQAWSFDLMQTGDAVRQLLYDWAEDEGVAGFDNVFGYGRGDALNIFDGALPVELSSFTAKVLKSGGIQLNWRTETEVSNYGFEIERLQNYNIEKLQDWEKIGFVEGNGNSNSPKDYSYTDLNAQYGNFAYRLKQIDTDGQFEYSKIIEVDAGNIPDEIVLEQNYPNPFNPVTTIRFSIPQSGNVQLVVYNLLGEQIAEPVNEFKEAGIHTINFKASELNSGIYLYKLEVNGFLQSRKMILLK